MTHSPTPDRDPNLEPPPPRPRRRWQRVALPVGLTVLAGTGGAVWWGWRFIHNELPGIVAENLSKTINRPVIVGDVQGITFNSLVIGESTIPPTAEDTDQATVKEIKVGFNLWQTLMSRKLKLDITLKDAVVFLEQQKEGWITTEFTTTDEEGPIEIGTIRAENVTAKLLGLGTVGGKRAPVILDQLNGKIDLFDENQRFEFDLAGRSRTGGTLKLVGETRLPDQATNLQIQAENFLVSEIDRLLNLPFDLATGRTGGNLNIELLPNIKQPPIKGTAQFEGVTMAIPGVPRPFTNAKGTLQFRGTQILPENVVGSYGKATATVNGAIDLDKGFNLTAKVNPIKLPDLVETLKLTTPVPLAGTVVADLQVTGGIETPILSGTAKNVGTLTVDRIPVSQFSTAFKLDTQAEKLVVQSLQMTPTAGGTVTGGGQIDLSATTAAGELNPAIAFTVNVQNVPGDAIARTYNDGNSLPVTIGAVSAVAQVSGTATNPVTNIRWQAPNATYAGTGEIQIANNAIAFRNTQFNVEGGTATVNAVARDGKWQAAIAGSQIPLQPFNPELRGLFSGNFTASGSLNSFQPADIRAQGNARFSEGVSVLDSPLTAQVQWNGQSLLIQDASAQGFNANGAIALKFNGTPTVTAMAVNVRLADFNLQNANVTLPGNIPYSGRVDFNGKITGTPTTPQANGTLALKDFVINTVAFEPYLSGKLQFNQGVRLDLRGDRDRIAATLNSQFQPVAFNLRRGEATAIGETRGGLLLVDVKNFPLGVAALPGTSPAFTPGGTLTANLAVDVNRQSANGTFAIEKPAIGNYRVDQFKGRINFAEGIATLTEGVLIRQQPVGQSPTTEQRPPTIVQLAGTANLLAADPQFNGQINVVQGNVQDVLETLQIFNLLDVANLGQPRNFGTAAQLETVPIDATAVSIQTQLRRLSEILAAQQIQQAKQDAAIVPPLEDLEGNFTGKIKVAGSLRTGVQADFDLRGQNFKWGKFNANDVVAVGKFQNNELTLLPLRLQTGDAVIAFAGTVLGETQSGQIRVENYPVEQLVDLLQSPIPLTGRVNATATISGSVVNPEAVGEYRLVNAELNGTAVQQVQGSFTLANARLDFSNTLAINPQEPLAITGSVPLPFLPTIPDSDRISLDINVRNEGLALLNVLTDQVAWIDGTGEVRVKVGGTFKEPVAVGRFQVQNATIGAKAVPGNLTNVNGTAVFVQDRLRVENFTADYSKGQIVASGVIPLANRLQPGDLDLENPLTVALKDINLNLKGLYRGGVDGNLVVTGAALDPILGGNIRLSNGQVVLNPEAAAAAGGGTGDANASPIEFNNLQISLGNGLLLTNPPILSFVAQGDVTINGPLDNLRPSGLIQLRSGQVNLFTTQFNLDRGFAQTAEFIPGLGLDPILNVRLVALVTEVRNRRQPSVLTPSEILDVPASATSLGSLQTVRVRAEARGPASQLFDNLELTSSPPRSETEIVALIGGSYIDTLGRGDTLLGVANLAGSALLSNVFTNIGRALGLSEFRIFPAYTTDNTRTDDNTTTLGLAGEAALDITPALSVSVLKILTNGDPAQFGLRYRINENLLLRSSTNFSGDNRASLEYELRF